MDIALSSSPYAVETIRLRKHSLSCVAVRVTFFVIGGMKAVCCPLTV